MDRRQRHHGSGQPPQPPGITIPAVKCLASGFAADKHINRHKLKIGQKKYQFDCGLDLFPSSGDYEVFESGSLRVINVSTLFHLVVPPGAFGLITDRSSTIEHLPGGWVLEGKIDATYIGELLVRIACFKDDIDGVLESLAWCAAKEVAIAQIIMCPYYLAAEVNFEISLVSKVDIGRGASGFGSTDPIIDDERTTKEGGNNGNS